MKNLIVLLILFPTLLFAQAVSPPIKYTNVDLFFTPQPAVSASSTVTLNATTSVPAGSYTGTLTMLGSSTSASIAVTVSAPTATCNCSTVISYVIPAGTQSGTNWVLTSFGTYQLRFGNTAVAVK